MKKRYNLINNCLGWICFLIAAVTYLLTVEPTASFWDCPEFIAQGAKLEVGHPPGNPIFMLTARFFITLFGGSMSSAALAVNSMSALLSAATILLLFWTITHLVRRLIVRDDADEISLWQMMLIMGGGVCGALAYTWSDTFWFSAVEGEVYAFSSFCTALVVWLMLKWENRADSPSADRYLVLIAYVIGVSIAVHLLNLLCIPALGLIYYYRRFKKVSALGSLLALGVSCVIVAAILYGLVPGFVQVAQWFELLFVNGFGLSYNMGVLIYAVVLIAVFITALCKIYSDKASDTGARIWSVLALALSGMPFFGHSVAIGVLVIILLFAGVFIFSARITRRWLALVVLSVMVIFVGYSSYALLLIRATANTPMNQNAPDNVFALASYLNREQYGDRPLLNGPVFAEALVEQEYPQNSGNFYIPVDENGIPQTTVIDGYLRDENSSVYNSPTKGYTKVVKSSPDEPDRYVAEISRPDYKTMPDLNMFLTRMYSNDPEGRHVSGYKAWAAYSTPDIRTIPREVRRRWAEKGYVSRYELISYLPNLTTVTTHTDSRTGAPLVQKNVWKPGVAANLRFFVNYQLNHMYWRYFMWNFAGRQNDMQGNGEPHLGNWISGIPVLDNFRLGDQSALPDEFGRGNKGHNVFYMLPLLLGLIGLLWQALCRHNSDPQRGIQQFWVVFFLFFMTGIAIVLYLNQTPGQPRERDYAFAGSFYAFAIWIGLGVPAIGSLLGNYFKKNRKARLGAAAFACAVGLFVPLQMVSQTWDDHDRSGRYTTRDFGFNYLNSLDENAIIFTNGDNDTFPLWYAQEVEGERTDVRVVNLSYLTTDWYANQMQHPTYEAEAIPMTARPEDYAYERLAYSFVVPTDDEVRPVTQSLRNLYDYDPSRYGAPLLESTLVEMAVDSARAMEVFSTGNPEIDQTYLAPALTDIQMDLSRLGNGLNQSRVLSLDMIANSVQDGFRRPVYFATTVPSNYYLGLNPYLSGAGMAYQVTPFLNPQLSPTADKTYVNILTKWRWGGLDAPDAHKLYLDETVRRMVASVRNGVYSTVEDLMATGKLPASDEARSAALQAGLPEPKTRFDMARGILNTLGDKMPITVAPFEGIMGLYFARTYLDLYMADGNTSDLDRAWEIASREADRYAQLVKYGTTLSPYDFSLLGTPERYGMQYLGEAVALLNRIDLLRADPSLRLDPDASRQLAALTFEEDLRIAPLVFVNAYDYATLAAELDNYDSGSRAVLRRAMDLLALNERAGVDPMKHSNELMNRYGFTSRGWEAVMH